MPRRSTLAVVVVLVLTGCARGPSERGEQSGAVTVGTAPPSVSLGSAPPPPALAVPPVDVVARRAVLTADGRRIPLDWVEPEDLEAPEVVRVPAGWLVTEWLDDGGTVWLLGEDGQRRSILTGADGNRARLFAAFGRSAGAPGQHQHHDHGERRSARHGHLPTSVREQTRTTARKVALGYRPSSILAGRRRASEASGSYISSTTCR